LKNGFTDESTTEELSGLPENEKIAFDELSDCTSSQNDDRRSNMGIFVTNALPLGTQIQMGGIFPKIARINHSCRPNLNYHFNSATGTTSVHVIRPIAIGDELTQAYFPPCRPFKDRQSYLLNSFNFNCSCESCSLHGQARADSDSRRSTVQTLATEARAKLKSLKLVTTKSHGSEPFDYNDFILSSAVKLIVENVEARIQLLIDEDLANPLQLMLCEYDAYEALKYEDEAAARRWLQLAHTHAVQAQGSSSRTSLLLKELLDKQKISVF
jgi:hypothetical protein